MPAPRLPDSAMNTCRGIASFAKGADQQPRHPKFMQMMTDAQRNAIARYLSAAVTG